MKPDIRCLRNLRPGQKPLIPYCTWPFLCNGDPCICGVRGGDRIYPEAISTRTDL